MFQRNPAPDRLRLGLAGLAILGVCLIGMVLPARRASAVPPGFTVETVASGLAIPVTMDFALDGRLFYNELSTGRVRIFVPGSGPQPAPFAQLTVSTSGEKGLLGLALHPDHEINGFVYVCYSTQSGGHEIGRFTEVNGVGTSYTVIVGNLPGSGIHNGGNIAFGPDGKLYHSMGDNAASGNSQNAATYPGKIHRFEPDGSIPADNPFPTGLASRYCMGLRNSFDLCWNHTLGLLYASENGPGSDDEVNRIVAGGNYGWPNLQCGGSGSFRPALTCWTPTIAPTGITSYEASQFGPEYLHDLFMADFNGGRIWRIHLDATGTTFQQRTVFHDETTSVYDVKVGPDGFLYYSTGTQIRRIRRLIPVDPPLGLACAVQGDDVLLTWTNQGSGAAGAYDSLQVRRDGLLVAVLPGDATSYLSPSPAGGERQYEVRALQTGNQSSAVACDVTVPVDPPQGFACDFTGLHVQLSWTNGEPYQGLLLFRSGSLLPNVMPAAESYTDLLPPAGPLTYELQGVLDGEFSAVASCAVDVTADFVRGDCGDDGLLTVADVPVILQHVVGVSAPPGCLLACDMDASGAIDIVDAVALLQFLFLGGPGSAACQHEFQPLGCLSYSHCP